MSRSVRTTTCLQYLQTSESDEPALNSIDAPQLGQGPLATAMRRGEEPLIASDLIDALPDAFAGLARSAPGERITVLNRT